MLDLDRSLSWDARWISHGENHFNCFVPVLPAPYLRKEFDFDGAAEELTLRICGLGYFLLYINGQRVGERELAPTFTAYDKRSRYLVYDIKPYLQKGRNAIGVVLGTGWYEAWTHGHWHYDRASWRDYPKLLLEICSGEQVIVKSDPTWRISIDGPLVKDGLMTGETYDARKEFGNWTQPGFDDSAWRNAVIVPGPGGDLTEETFPGVQVVERIRAQKISSGVWDAGKILAGWAAIRVSGEAGAQVKLTFSDRLQPDGKLFMDHNRMYCEEPDFQTDTYILKGDPAGESWHPSFVWHGFRYVGVEISGKARLLDVTAEIVSSAARRIGHFACSNEMLNRIYDCTVNSYVANFPGYPTDCPHREKLGWTGDAHCAAGAGLSMFDMADIYAGWLQSIADSQRPSGALPGIVPTTGWGFNWGNGAFFDYVLPGIVQTVYQFSGDLEIVRKFYPNMKRLISYYQTIAEDDIISCGLGDWSHFDLHQRADDRLVLTAYYYGHIRAAWQAAELLELEVDAAQWRSLAKSVASAFEKNFYRGEGVYGKGEPSAQALAIEFGLCPEERIPLAAAKLDAALREHDYQAYFGIAGGKYILEVLSRCGYGESAYKVATQEQVPGWAAWINDGATALRESWDSQKSHCHIMFGSIVYWMMHSLVGLAPEPDRPGFRFIRIAPVIPEDLQWAEASIQTPLGLASVAWRKGEAGAITFDITLPEGSSGELVLPGMAAMPLSSGVHQVKL